MASRFMLVLAAISGFIYVALGAFGAHVLSRTLGVVEMGWIQTGLQYQAFHTPVPYTHLTLPSTPSVSLSFVSFTPHNHQ